MIDQDKIIDQVVEDIKSGNYNQARVGEHNGQKQVKFSFSKGFYAAISEDGSIWISILQSCEGLFYEEAVNMAEVNQIEKLTRIREDADAQIKALQTKFNH